jgi:hypothetical protein
MMVVLAVIQLSLTWKKSLEGTADDSSAISL